MHKLNLFLQLKILSKFIEQLKTNENFRQVFTEHTNIAATVQISQNLSTFNNFSKSNLRVGAWYLGWIVIASVLFTFSIIMGFFPKELPRSAVRKRIANEIEKRKSMNNFNVENKKDDSETSLKDFGIAFKRLLNNKIFMLNNFAGIFYIFG